MMTLFTGTYIYVSPGITELKAKMALEDMVNILELKVVDFE